MTSPSSSNPRAYSADGPSLEGLHVPTLSLSESGHVIPMSGFIIEGVGRGNIEGLRARPFADFHPVERVELSADRCEVSYAKPLRPLQDRRHVRLDEVVNLTRQLIEAKRRLVADQRLYLYPGLEAFGVDPSCNRLRFRVINVRPEGRFRVSSHDQLSVEALCVLMESYCPEGWALIKARRASINTLEGLYALIDRRRGLSTAWALLKLLFVGASLGAFLSVPLAIWGPESVSEPLSDFMMPRVLHFLDQLEERRALMRPRATMKVKLELSLPQQLSPELQDELYAALSEALKRQAGSNGQVTPRLTGSGLWVAELSVYRGDLNELLRELASQASSQLAGRRMLTPSELELLVRFTPQIASQATQPKGAAPAVPVSPDTPPQASERGGEAR